MIIDLFNKHAITIALLELVIIILFTVILIIMIKNRELKVKTTTDALTGLHNHHYLNERLNEELSRALRLNHKMQILFIDLNNFKAMNDNFGHDAGDELLIQTAEILRDTLRRHDIYGRWYSGDEFFIILPETDDDQAHDAAERISLNIEDAAKTITRGQEVKNGNGHIVEIGASIGILSFNPADPECRTMSSSELIKKVDAKMYKKKRATKMA